MVKRPPLRAIVSTSAVAGNRAARRLSASEVGSVVHLLWKEPGSRLAVGRIEIGAGAGAGAAKLESETGTKDEEDAALLLLPPLPKPMPSRSSSSAGAAALELEPVLATPVDAVELLTTPSSSSPNNLSSSDAAAAVARPLVAPGASSGAAIK